MLVKEQKGGIDVLFANAGIAEFKPLGSITESHFDKSFDINVKGLLFTVQKKESYGTKAISDVNETHIYQVAYIHHLDFSTSKG